jgi:hypothetical protein
LFNLVVEIRKKVDLRAADFKEILGFKDEILGFEDEILRFEGGL